MSALVIAGYAALMTVLGVDPRATGEPRVGALLVAGQDRVLAVLRDALEVLAAQATLALERIALTDAVNRRDSDQYVHTVVRNTTDVVLVVDEDGRIRCASPSVALVLGAEPPAFGMLRDLFHPDDHDQVTRTLTLAHGSSGAEGVSDRWSLRRPDGSLVVVEVSYRDLRRDRMVHGFVITLRDVTEDRRRQRERIQRALQASPAGLNRQSVANKFR